ncbi:hypothetical protein SNEBB_001746 [Seison nebaliae]|nr:hypothetical protein SNEBB_001746 [Seison nebaliae]
MLNKFEIDLFKNIILQHVFHASERNDKKPSEEFQRFLHILITSREIDLKQLISLTRTNKNTCKTRKIRKWLMKLIVVDCVSFHLTDNGTINYYLNVDSLYTFLWTPHYSPIISFILAEENGNDLIHFLLTTRRFTLEMIQTTLKEDVNLWKKTKKLFEKNIIIPWLNGSLMELRATVENDNFSNCMTDDGDIGIRRRLIQNKIDSLFHFPKNEKCENRSLLNEYYFQLNFQYLNYLCLMENLKKFLIEKSDDSISSTFDIIMLNMLNKNRLHMKSLFDTSINFTELELIREYLRVYGSNSSTEKLISNFKLIVAESNGIIVHKVNEEGLPYELKLGRIVEKFCENYFFGYIKRLYGNEALRIVNTLFVHGSLDYKTLLNLAMVKKTSIDSTKVFYRLFHNGLFAQSEFSTSNDHSASTTTFTLHIDRTSVFLKLFGNLLKAVNNSWKRLHGEIEKSIRVIEKKERINELLKIVCGEVRDMEDLPDDVEKKRIQINKMFNDEDQQKLSVYEKVTTKLNYNSTQILSVLFLFHFFKLKSMKVS